jgi:hypothetical protein
MGTNLYDYGFGEHEAEGVGSQGFWVSTGVDLGMSVATGLAVAGGGALLVTAGVVAAPVAILGVAIAGALISVGFEFGGVGASIKDGINSYIDEQQAVALAAIGGHPLEDMGSGD